MTVSFSIVAGCCGRSRPSVGSALERVDHVHPRRDLAEHGVLAVEPRRGVGGDDEELRAVRVRAGVGHRQRAADDLVVVELVLERVARAAGAGALRAAALDHEVADDPVERQAVVEALAGQRAEVVDGLGRVVVEQLEDDVAVVGGHRGLGHADLLPVQLRIGSSASAWPLSSVPSSAATTRSASSRRAPRAARSARAARTSADGLAVEARPVHGGDQVGLRQAGGAAARRDQLAIAGPVARLVVRLAVAARRLGRRRRRDVRALRPRRDLRVGVPLDRLERALLARLDERDRAARAPDAAGAPDAVDVDVG